MEIESGLRVITAPNPGIMTGSGTNQYLIGRERCVLIDAALGTVVNLELVGAELEQAEATLEAVLVTHIHPDHIGGATEVTSRFGARLGMHASRRGYAGLEPGWVYKDGDVIPYDGGSLRVLHTPGHESGHCCFFEPARRWLFTGDHVVGEGTVVIAPPDGDMGDYISSLSRLLELPARLLLGGHGPVVTDPRAKIQEYLDHRLDRERQVLDCLREGRNTISGIVESIYREFAPVLHPVAAKSVEAHLLKLSREGRVRRSGDRYFPG